MQFYQELKFNNQYKETCAKDHDERTICNTTRAIKCALIKSYTALPKNQNTKKLCKILQEINNKRKDKKYKKIEI